MSKKKKITPQSFSEFLESEGANQTVKLYSHDGANITIAEIPKEDIDSGRLFGKYFTDYDECKEDRDFTCKVKEMLHDGLRCERARIDQLESDCKSGLDMLLDRIKELESELEPKDEQKVKKELNVFVIMLIGVVSLILGFGLFHLVN